MSALPHQLMFLFFPAALAMAAALDLVTMKIPNRLSAALAVGYFVTAFFAGVPTDPSAPLSGKSAPSAIVPIVRWVPLV